METVPINERKLIKRQFRKCYNVIELEDRNSRKFLKKNRSDNILIIRKFKKNNYKVDCYTRSDIKEIIKPRGYPPYLSKNCKDKTGKYELYYPLNIGGVECYFTKNEIEKILQTNFQIYYVEPIIIDNEEFKVDCQERINTIYKIKVCGGRNCLPMIFRDESDIPEYNENEDDENDFDEIDFDVSPDPERHEYIKNEFIRLLSEGEIERLKQFINELLENDELYLEEIINDSFIKLINDWQYDQVSRFFGILEDVLDHDMFFNFRANQEIRDLLIDAGHPLANRFMTDEEIDWHVQYTFF